MIILILYLKKWAANFNQNRCEITDLHDTMFTDESKSFQINECMIFFFKSIIKKNAVSNMNNVNLYCLLNQQ